MLHYYYRISIAFGVLFAAGWMQLSRAEPSDDEKIDYLVATLERVRSSGLVAEGGINHFESWDSWNNTSDQFKLRCVREFGKNIRMTDMKLTLEDTDILGALAYKALDSVINGSAHWMKGLVGENEHLKNGIDRTLKEGKFIHLSAFMTDHLSGPIFATIVNDMRQNTPTISKSEIVARIFADYLLLEFV